jgi:hypothetical protein
VRLEFKICFIQVKTHLEGERVRQALPGEPFQGRVRDDAAIPIVFAVDFDRGEPRRQRAARHHMLGPDDIRRESK